MVQPVTAATEPPDDAAKHHRNRHPRHASTSSRRAVSRKVHPHPNPHPVFSTTGSSSTSRRLPPPSANKANSSKGTSARKHPPHTHTHTSRITCPFCRSQATDSPSPSATTFLCVACAKHRIARYIEHLAKLQADTRHARARVEALLGPLIDDETQPNASTSSSSNRTPTAVPDPFGPQSDLPRNPHPVASHAARCTRAEWETLNSRIASHRRLLTTSEEECAALRSSIAQKRTHIKERRERLHIARQTISEDAAIQGDPAWYKRTVQRDILDLKKQSKEVGEAVARATKSKCQGVLSLYGIAPPARASQQRRQNIPGAFPRPSLTPPPPPPSAPSEWTLLSHLAPANRLSIPLPTSSDLARFSRDDINASVAIVAHLEWLLADILGVALPFSLGLAERKGQKGRKWTCKLDPLLPLNGLGSLVQPRGNYTLHLGKSAYSALISTQQQSNTPAGTISSPSTNPAESSIVSLGMSTITTTLESFVHLPLPGTGIKRESSSSAAGKGPGAAEPSSSSSSSSSSASVQEFQLALTMLSYNAAYLCWRTQLHGDPPVDLLRAGGPILELLWRLVPVPVAVSGRGRQGTSTGPTASAAGDSGDLFPLTPPVEFSKLVQLHGIGVGSSSAPAAGHQTHHRQRRPGTAATKALSRIDESYVDAGRVDEAEVQGDTETDVDVDGASTPTRTSQRQHRIDESYIDAATDAASVILRSNKSKAINGDGTGGGTSGGSRPAPGSARPVVHNKKVPGAASGSSNDGNSARANSVATSSTATPTAPITTLEFLRQRGQKARRDAGGGPNVSAQTVSTPSTSKTPLPSPAKASGGVASGSGSGSVRVPPSAQTQKPSPTSSTPSRAGVVIFNGKEIRPLPSHPHAHAHAHTDSTVDESADEEEEEEGEGDWEAV